MTVKLMFFELILQKIFLFIVLNFFVFYAVTLCFLDAFIRRIQLIILLKMLFFVSISILFILHSTFLNLLGKFHELASNTES